MNVAALFVATGGVYFGLPGVDPWDERRDARLYAGPWPVVAHPPCDRWGRYWSGGPSAAVRRIKGDDGGCFSAGLSAVRAFGGVIEHPADSHAWRAFDLPPPLPAGWCRDLFGGWCARVEQGNYGHRARKATWLYYVGRRAPDPIKWGAAPAGARLDQGFHTAAERAAADPKLRQARETERLSKVERTATPLPFRDLLLGLARGAWSV